MKPKHPARVDLGETYLIWAGWEDEGHWLAAQIGRNGRGKADNQFDFLSLRFTTFSDMTAHLRRIPPGLLDRGIQRLRDSDSDSF